MAEKNGAAKEKVLKEKDEPVVTDVASAPVAPTNTDNETSTELEIDLDLDLEGDDFEGLEQAMNLAEAKEAKEPKDAQ